MPYLTDQNHPEQSDDEVFLGNISEDGFDRSMWKTKRLGEQAFREDTGALIRSEKGIGDIYPMFVKRNELESAGVILNKERV